MDDLNVCGDEGYLAESALGPIKELGWRVQNLINGYGRYLRQRKAKQTPILREVAPDYEATAESEIFPES